jgi:hypothetical protein
LLARPNRRAQLAAAHGEDTRAALPQRPDEKILMPLMRKITRRRIPLAVVESVLENPQPKVSEHGEVMCYQSKVEINQKEYLVRVMVNEMARPAKVVTVYRTSKIRKYWKTTP